jgi:hypothetical protein
MEADLIERYCEFVAGKSQLASGGGFEPQWLPSQMFDFQAKIATWAMRKGRAAIFADCGLGKTLIQLAFAENVVRRTNKPFLILTPLAVSHQTVAEAEKFGIEATRSSDGTLPASGIVVSNYERLRYFDPSKLGGVVCDESSILKSFEGSTRVAITEFMRRVEYRLLCTATAAPNDYTELGTSSEALGCLGYTDMLGRFFKNSNDSVKPFSFGLRGAYDGGQWRLKGHAERAFWRWVCSWARALRKPSDVGCDDTNFVLPKLTETEHIIASEKPAPGYLFTLPAVGLAEQRAERRRTIGQRCDKVLELVGSTGKQAIVWCHLNVEGDALEKMIPGAVQVSGDDSDERKEEIFTGFANGHVRVLVTKPSIGAWGLNFQNCAHMTFFPSHSYEQQYQGLRRCWRFGQKHPVQADIITSQGESGVLANLQRKAKKADVMFANLVAEMNNAEGVKIDREFTKKLEVPPWL